MVRRAKQEYLIRSLGHSLDVLEALSQSPAGISLAPLARQVGLHKNSVFRLMATLENRGYIERNPATGNCRLGLQAFESGYAYLHHTSLSAAARPVLAALSRDLEENAYLSVLREGYVFYQEAAAENRTVRVASRLGSRLPLGCTATGKAFMAWMSRPELARFIARPMPCTAGREPPSPEPLLDELRLVRESGYAVDLGGWEPGVNCVASPLFDFHGLVAGVLSVTAPSYRMEGERLLEAGEAVRRRAAEVSRRLGYLPGDAGA